ncbi:MAG: YceH family protein [Gemmataceae bacterium]|nr:YceH family protein [Gemmataceae bacterium]
MSSEPLPPPHTWDPLAEEERRVLGVLVEKQKTSKTADSYPLTLNALTTGCNQKSNRDPVLDLTEDEVEETVSALQKKGLVMRQTGGRVERFKHLLYEKWTGDGPQLAVLAELLLRGPQTKGELRGRASRMAPIDTLDDLEGVLRPLAARRLVVPLTDPGRRGAVLTHGFHTPDELARAKAQAGARADADERPPAAPTGEREASAPRDAALEARVAAVEAGVAELKAIVADLRRQLGG